MVFVDLLKVAYFLVPAYFANMAPVIWKPIFPWLAIPLDGGKTFKGNPLFGSNKTWRGLFLAVITGALIGFLQYSFSPKDWLFVDSNSGLLIGAVIGLGAIIGDLAKSFIKRRLGRSPGSSWVPYDQIDYTLGALLFVAPIYFPGWILSLELILVCALGHVLIKWLGSLLGLE